MLLETASDIKFCIVNVVNGEESKFPLCLDSVSDTTPSLELQHKKPTPWTAQVECKISYSLSYDGNLHRLH